MKRMSIWLAVFALITTVPQSELAAQFWQAGPPGADLGSIRLHLGVLQPMTDYSDGSTLNSGASFGVGGVLWPTRYLGFMADVFRSQNQVSNGGNFSALDGQDPTVWLYSLNAALRFPVISGGVGITPYVAAGPMAKSYKWAIYQPQMGGLFNRPYGGGRNTSFGWTYGGGLELRLGQTGDFGITTDIRSIHSDFDWFGLRTDQSDLLLTAGITLHR